MSYVLHFDSGGVLKWPRAETCGLTSIRIRYVYFAPPYRMSHSYPTVSLIIAIKPISHFRHIKFYKHIILTEVAFFLKFITTRHCRILQ